MAILAAPVCVGAAAELPDGVRAVWDLGKAFREKTGTRERVSINGLWRWQPAGEGDAIPADGWGFLRVPEAWPGGSREWGTTTFFPHAEWAGRKDLGNVTAAWQ